MGNAKNLKESTEALHIGSVSGSYSDDKLLTEIEYLEYMSKKAKTVNIITYPDGSKGELNKGIIVLL
jgi:hypothetical protein